MFARTLGIVGLSLLLTACINDLVEIFPGAQPLPEESIAELIAQQVTLTVYEESFPESVGASFADESIPSVYAGDLRLNFLLLADEMRPRSDGDYFYSFSKESNGEFEVLQNLRFSELGAVEKFYIELYRIPLFLNLNDVPDAADEYLDESSPIFPIDATHVDLRFLPMTSNEYELVLKVPLENLMGWRRYISPLTVRN